MKLPLVGGAYQARSIIANAQRCINLYPERNPEDAPFPYTHYPTPGLTQLYAADGKWRGLYRASNGTLFGVLDEDFCKIADDWTVTVLGNLTSVAAGEILGATISAGTGYYPPTWTDTYSAVALTGGTGSGAVANILVALGKVSSVTLTAVGSGFVVGDVLTATLGGQIATGTITNPGAGYTDGTYLGRIMTGGSGTDARAGITVAGGVVTSVVWSGSSQRKGVQYAALDALSASLPAGAGFAYRVDTVSSQGTGFAYTVTSVTAGSDDTRPVVMADNGLCLVLVDGNPIGYACDLTTLDFDEIADTNFLGATFVDYVDTYFVFNKPDTNQWYISLSNVSYAGLTGGGVESGTITGGGTGYYPATSPETYFDVPLLGGSGTGATADLYASLGVVRSVTITEPGEGYQVGDTLTATLGGQIATFTILNGGSGYSGSALAQPISGGTGHGALASVTVAGGVVTAIDFTGVSQRKGAQYAAGDLCTWDDGAGTGFQFRIDTVANQGTDFVYTVASISNTGFDPLDLATKTGFPDPIQCLVVLQRQVWLLGTQTGELWYNTGAADFTFGIMPGAFIEHGCVAPYSLAKQDVTLFWLGQDKQGAKIVLKGEGSSARRVSTHAIEATFANYATVSDAIGYTYQQDGHTFYVLTFPCADATWVFDVATELWHQRGSLDSDGVLHRHRGNCAAFAYGTNVVGDYTNGDLYAFDLDVFTENGTAIPRIRSFPHLQNEDQRVTYRSFIADIEVGTKPLTTTDEPPQCWLRWSDDRGATWSSPVLQSLGSGGQYRTSVQWNRLGMARDRVFELGWSADAKVALNGAYIDPVLHDMIGEQPAKAA